MINLGEGWLICISLKGVVVDFGWDPNATDTDAEYRIDASASMLDGRHKVTDAKFFVFDNNECFLVQQVSSRGPHLPEHVVSLGSPPMGTCTDRVVVGDECANLRGQVISAVEGSAPHCARQAA